MITAIDTSILLDVFSNDATYAAASAGAVRSCLSEGHLIASDVVWAEVSAFFPSSESARSAMTTLEVDFDAMPIDAALAAGAAWRRYRARGGRRDRVMADFLIGAHALARADRLLTRDRGFYRGYFSRLGLIDPSA